MADVAAAAGVSKSTVSRHINWGQVARATVKDGLEDLQSRHPLIGDVSGIGGMLGIELVRDRRTKEPAVAERNAFARAAIEEGVVIPDAMGDSARCLFIPPAVMTHAEIDLCMEVMDRALSTVEEASGSPRTHEGH